MRYLLAIILLALTVSPARAAESRVILDASLIVVPANPVQVCMRLDQGTVAVTTRLVPSENATMPDGRPRFGEYPVDVALYAYRGRSDMPGIATTATLAEALAITPVPGGVYCLDVVNRAVVPPGQNPNFWGQWIAIRITHEPS